MAEPWPPRFGYEAVRVPLFFVWAGLGERAPALCRVQAFWRASAAPPAWIDLTTGEVAEYRLSTGGMAVRALLLDRPLSRSLPLDRDYYSASLRLLTLVARQEQPAGAGLDCSGPR